MASGEIKKEMGVKGIEETNRNEKGLEFA